MNTKCVDHGFAMLFLWEVPKPERIHSGFSGMFTVGRKRALKLIPKMHSDKSPIPDVASYVIFTVLLSYIGAGQKA